MHVMEKEMATHSSVLAWRIPGTEEPGGLPSMGSLRVGHDWCDLAAAAWIMLHHVSCRCSQYRGFASNSFLNWLRGQGHDFLWVTETLWIWGGGFPSSWSSCKCLKWPCYFLHCNSYNFLKSCRLMNLSN